MDQAAEKTCRTLDIGNGIMLYYEEMGSGRPILFVHGIWGSCRFFHKQLPWFGRDYRAIALDLRGHGRSSMTLYGQTVKNYASDVHAFIEQLALRDVVWVGWSMGAFVMWEYYRMFGDHYVSAFVNIDESPTDMNKPDFEIGMITADEIFDWFYKLQTRRNDLLVDVIPMMFMNEVDRSDFQWIFDEMTRAPEAIAAAVFADQTVQDYRDVIVDFPIPTLNCFGADEKLQKVEAGRWIQKSMRDAKLEVFENSGHCPFLEEPTKFNEVVDAFVKGLGA